MSARRFSRYTFAEVSADETTGRLTVRDRSRYRFENRSDLRRHVVEGGQSLFTIAERRFPGFSRGAGLWWVIADFQPSPIHDPTIAVTTGRLLFVPSEQAVLERLFSSRRRS